MEDLWKIIKVEAQWAWGHIWDFYLIPFTSLREGYINKPLNMSVAQSIIYPLNAISNGYKAWNERDNAHRQTKYSA